VCHGGDDEVMWWSRCVSNFKITFGFDPGYCLRLALLAYFVAGDCRQFFFVLVCWCLDVRRFCCFAASASAS
jgi:hypothetical protein